MNESGYGDGYAAASDGSDGNARRRIGLEALTLFDGDCVYPVFDRDNPYNSCNPRATGYPGYHDDSDYRRYRPRCIADDHFPYFVGTYLSAARNPDDRRWARLKATVPNYFPRRSPYLSLTIDRSA